MKHLTLEVIVSPSSNEVRCWRSAPAYGGSHEPRAGYLQRFVLNDGAHRVKVGVYGRSISESQVKMLARLALSAQGE